MAQNGGVGPNNPKRKKGANPNPGNPKGNGPGKPPAPPKQPKQGRNEYAYLNLPGNKQLHEETSAATNIAYRPTERSIAAEKRASQSRTKNIGTWWNEYLKQVGAGQAATAGAYANAASQTQGIIGTASAVDSANTAAQNSEATSAAAARGQDASAANAATTGTANAAQAQRNAAIGALGARTAGQGANQYAYLGEKKRIGSGQRVASLINQTKKTASIEGDRTALRKERGEYAVKTLGQKQAEAREIKLKRKAFELEKHAQAASTKAGAHKAELEYKEHLQEQREKAAERGEERAKTNAELGNENRQTRVEEEEAATKRYEAQHPNASSSSPTPKQEARGERKQAWAGAKSLFEKQQWPSWAALETKLRKESEITPSAARWAVQKLREQVEAEEAHTHSPGPHGHR